MRQNVEINLFIATTHLLYSYHNLSDKMPIAIPHISSKKGHITADIYNLFAIKKRKPIFTKRGDQFEFLPKTRILRHSKYMCAVACIRKKSFLALREDKLMLHARICIWQKAHDKFFGFVGVRTKESMVVAKNILQMEVRVGF